LHQPHRYDNYGNPLCKNIHQHFLRSFLFTNNWTATCMKEVSLNAVMYDLKFVPSQYPELIYDGLW